MSRGFLLLLFLAFSISTAAAQSTIFIVRHAEKAESASKDPSLSEAGRARAQALAKILKDGNLTAIYASEFKRTQETATPLARVTGIEVTIVPAAETTVLAARLKTSPGNAVVVGHGNTIPDLVKALGLEASINLAETDYDNLFVIVTGEKPRLIRLHYP